MPRDSNWWSSQWSEQGNNDVSICVVFGHGELLWLKGMEFPSSSRLVSLKRCVVFIPLAARSKYFWILITYTCLYFGLVVCHGAQCRPFLGLGDHNLIRPHSGILLSLSSLLRFLFAYTKDKSGPKPTLQDVSFLQQTQKTLEPFRCSTGHWHQ